jgi:hypothetical protein
MVGAWGMKASKEHPTSKLKLSSTSIVVFVLACRSQDLKIGPLCKCFVMQ